MTDEPDKKEPDTEEDKDEETQESPITDIERAHVAAKAMKKENDRRETIVAREEKLEISRTLGGRADAGKPEVKKEKLTDEEYADAYTKSEVDPFKEDGYK